jgi:hypothetical protein
MNTNELIPWVPTDIVALPKNAPPAEIVHRAAQLTERDRKAVVSAFENGSYEMAATFVWSKAAATLKKQLAGLGMAFVGEMLGRTDLTEASNPITDIREDEAIELAEQLAMISTTEALRLRNGQVLVNHFLDPETSHNEEMHLEEAVSVVRACVVNFLSEPVLGWQQPFFDLRTKLETETLKESASEIQTLGASPYFYVRTTLTVLLTQLKVAAGAKLEHAAGNINALLPVMWAKLRDKDKWQTGETYAIVQASNRPVAAAGLRRALMRVKGFDFIPETLRSETFRAAARAVLTAHFGFDNYHNEPRPMEALANLGSSVPGPALADCFSAALCVKLGNNWGHSWAAQDPADRFLKLFRPNQWEYYFNRMLPGDRRVLEKLAFNDKPLARWQELLGTLDMDGISPNPRVAKMLAAEAAKRSQVKKTAQTFREKIMQET